MCYDKFKETNQICSPLQISQSINAEQLTCNRNNKGIYSCFYESKKFLVCLMDREREREREREEKTEDGENVFF